MVALATALTPAARAAITEGGGEVLGRLTAADPAFAAAYRDHRRAHGQRILGFDLFDRTMLEDPAAELTRLVAAGQATDPVHVCFLELDEVCSWLVDRSDRANLIRTRRGNRQWALGQIPPPFFGSHPTLPDPNLFPRNVGRVMQIFNLVIAHDSRPSELPSGADGVAASPGSFTGPARIVHSAADLDRVQPGEVLIAPITTSPWEVVFPHIGALVTEGGGLLSHPAIVAREYRLPAVVGCEGAMDRFHDGQPVTVNGTAGTVRAADTMK